jgi:hypothetical protein
MVILYLVALNEYFILKHQFYFTAILCLYARGYMLMYVYVYTHVNNLLQGP